VLFESKREFRQPAIGWVSATIGINRYERRRRGGRASGYPSIEHGGRASGPKSRPYALRLPFARGHSHVPGAFTKGTNHFANAGHPADAARLAEYENDGPYKAFGERVQTAFANIVPDDADVQGVADAIVEIVNTPFGKRPFRVIYDPTHDGANVSFAVIDRIRAEMLRRVNLADLLTPAKLV
jgi:hypothetical protein